MNHERKNEFKAFLENASASAARIIVAIHAAVREVTTVVTTGHLLHASVREDEDEARTASHWKKLFKREDLLQLNQ